MRNHFRIVFPCLLLLLLALWVGPVLAQEREEGTDATPAETSEPAPAQPTPEPVGADEVLDLKPSPPHWFNFVHRIGLGLGGQQMRLKYRNVRDGQEDTFDASGGGSADMHLPSAWFFPAKGRCFLVSAGFGGGSAKGTFETDEKDSEFLDGKEYWRGYWFLPVGVGYRWLLGSEDQVSLNLFGELHWMFTSLYMEGAKDPVDLNGGGAGIFFGAHYRYDNGLLMGGALEVRGFGSSKKATRLAGELVDVNLSGNVLMLSFIIGYEPRNLR